MILDASFQLDIKDGAPDAFSKDTELYDAGVVQRVAFPSVWELHYGAAYADSVEERRKVQNLLTMYPQVELDEHLTARAAELLAAADREASGASGVDNEDALIGAVGEHSSEPVLSRNAARFDRLGVDVETY